MESGTDFKRNLSNEDRLLPACARVCPEEERSELIKRLVREDIDWHRLQRNAQRHGLSQLLYRHLNAIVPEQVPEQIMGQMREQFRKTALRNLHLAGELIRLTDLFKENRIEAIPFKGPLLAAGLYGNLALRPFSDLDILVHKDNLPAVAEILFARKYKLMYSLNHVIEAAPHLPLRLLTDEIVFISDEFRRAVDLHMSLLPGGYSDVIDIKGLRDRLAPVTMGGRKLYTFRPEDLLLYLCAHGGKHFWQNMMWIADVAMLLKTHNDIRWGIILEQAEKSGFKRMLFMGLALARELLGAGLPEKVSQEVKTDTAVAALVEQVAEDLFDENVAERMSFGKFRRYLKIWERAKDRNRFCIHMVMSPHPKDFFLLRLPTLFFFLYYLFRPLRLLLKHGPARLAKFIFRYPNG